MEYKSIVVTLFQGHYHKGVAALLNSLQSSGFNGLVRIGYNGPLPDWIKQFKNLQNSLFVLSDSIHFEFVLLEKDIHFGYYKPYFLKESMVAFPSADRFYYFDPDIVVIAPWSFYTNWTNSGVTLCTDNCFPYVYRNHPWRNDWIELAKDSYSTFNPIDFYVNSGYVGLKRSDLVILERWIVLTEKYRSIGGDLSQFEKDGHRSVKGDQDLLNAAITISPDVQYSVIGSEGMGFSYPAYLMAHAVGNIKPWKENYIRNVFLKGTIPSFAAKCYYQHCNKPIIIYSSLRLMYERFCLKFASLLGRIFC